MISCKSSNDPLKNLLDQINKIKTVSYVSELGAIKTETKASIGSSKIFAQIYSNPYDNFMGICYSYSLTNDKTKPDLLYDGRYYVKLDWKNKNALIDLLTDEKKVILTVPFFVKVKFLIQYATNHSDSSKLSIENFKDSSKISLLFPDKLVEYYRTYPYIKNAPDSYTSFELLINNKNHLPYKLISITPRITYSEKCSEINVSYKKGKEFISLNQIPNDFSRVQSDANKEITLPSSEPISFPAPDWKLAEARGDTISLKNLKSKVLLVEFTGISCSPCNGAIPFLKQLVIDYKNKDFEFVSIETEPRTISELQKHKKENGMNYKYLIGNKDVTTKYKVDAVPYFFIIDEKRMVRKIMFGYITGTTDKQIMDAIDKLL